MAAITSQWSMTYVGDIYRLVTANDGVDDKQLSRKSGISHCGLQEAHTDCTKGVPNYCLAQNCILDLHKWSSGTKALSECKRAHAHIMKSGFGQDRYVANLVLGMYHRSGCLEDALKMFISLPHRNVVSWNIMIAAYIHARQINEALFFFNQMHMLGVRRNVVSWNSIISGYVRQEHLDRALELFKQMQQEGIVPSVVTWTAIITGCAQEERGDEALHYFQKMYEHGERPDKVTYVSILSACPAQALMKGKNIHACIIADGLETDVFVATALVNMYAKCELLDAGRTIFNTVHIKDVILWNAMISAYGHLGFGMEALLLYKEMQLEGMIPDMASFISVLTGCASLAALQHGKTIHACIIVRGFESDNQIGTALVNMYCKSGRLDIANEIFTRLKQLDTISWTSLIAGYAQHGDSKKVLQMFRHMQLKGVKPDSITFGNILSACSHGGLLEQCPHYFVSLVGDHKLVATMGHYGCVIDILGRVGWLDQAEDLVNGMALETDVMAWTTLLSACNIHGDVERGKHATSRAIELAPESHAPYILLSNIYASLDKLENIQQMTRQQCIRI